MPIKESIDKRKFFRHPITVPILIQLLRGKDANTTESINISQGGLAFLWTEEFGEGEQLRITIPVKEKQFKIKARVAYSRKCMKTGLFQTGVAFLDYVSAFQAKLAEETIEILEYQKNLSKRLGHEVPEEEAAKQWIQKFAPNFPLF